MNWFKPKNSEPQIEIECPNCGQAQMVSESISAIFCKSCKKTIYTKKALKKPEADSSPVNAAPLTPPLSASGEKTGSPLSSEAPKQPVQNPAAKIPEELGSPIPAPSVIQPPKSPASVAQAHGSTMRKIKCFNCNTNQEVPSIALASFCEKCGQRINLQDYKIKGRFHGELETRGEIRIATGAEVKANLNVGIAVIDGRIDGKITAENRVILNEGCLVVGSIIAPAMIMNEGAGFVGKAVINPPAEEKPEA